jgi:hypothetical protein
LAFLDNGGDNTGTPYFLDPFSYNIRYVKRTWPSGWGTEQLVEADLTNKNASPAVSLNEGFVRIFWVSQPQDWITYRRLDNDGWISRPVYLVDEQTDTFETAGNYGYDGITNPFVQLFSGKFGLLWLTKGGSYKLKFALQSFTGEYETRDTAVFDSIKAHFEKVSSAPSFAVTRSELTLGDRDSITGQYALEYTDETIEMMLVDKSNQRFAMELGYIVHLDALGYTTDVVRVYDRIVDSVGRRWLVQTVTPIFIGSVFQFYVCELKEMSLYVE